MKTPNENIMCEELAQLIEECSFPNPCDKCWKRNQCLGLEKAQEIIKRAYARPLLEKESQTNREWIETQPDEVFLKLMWGLFSLDFKMTRKNGTSDFSYALEWLKKSYTKKEE